MRLERFSNLVGSIYAAAQDFALWEGVLTDLADITGSEGAVMMLPQADGSATTIAARFSPESCFEYDRDYAAICPRIGFLAVRPDIPVHYDSLVITDEEARRDPTYAFYARQGLRYYAGSTVFADDALAFAFSIQRSFAQGHVGRDQIAIVGMVREHVIQALAMSRRMTALEGRPLFAEAGLMVQPHAIFVLDGRGRVLVRNHAAERLIAAADGLAETDGVLRPDLAGERQVFDEMVRRALAMGHAGPAGWAWVSRRSEGPRLAVTAMPLPRSETAHLPGEGRALVMFVDPARPLAPDRAALRELFGLTEAEIRVAALLVGGYDRPSAARALGVSEQTLRTHAKAIFAKMGINRQSDLVRVISLFRDDS